MLIDQIEKDYKQALKDKDNQVLSVLRMLKSALHNKQIELKKDKLTEEEVAKIIGSEAKKRKDSITAYQQGGRDDLVQQEKAELEVIVKYLPEQLSEEEIKKIVEEIVGQDPTLADPSAFGQVMGQVMKKVQGQADGNLVQKIVKQTLSR